MKLKLILGIMIIAISLLVAGCGIQPGKNSLSNFAGEASRQKEYFQGTTIQTTKIIKCESIKVESNVYNSEIGILGNQWCIKELGEGYSLVSGSVQLKTEYYPTNICSLNQLTIYKEIPLSIISKGTTSTYDVDLNNLNKCQEMYIGEFKSYKKSLSPSMLINCCKIE